MTKKKQALHIGGMTCVNCQNRIEEKLKKLSGKEHEGRKDAKGKS